MPTSDDDDDDDDSFPSVVVIDRGAFDWKVGFAGDEDFQMLSAPRTDGDPASAEAAQFKTAFEYLDVEPADHAVLLSEQPDETAEQRAARSSDLTPHEEIFGVPVGFTTGFTPSNSQADE